MHPQIETRRLALAERYELASAVHAIGGAEFEIVHVADPAVLLDELAERNPADPDLVDERMPYWAELWPSAIGLTRLILESDLVRHDSRVIELGCGLGLPGIAAAGRCRDVLMTDYQEDALRFAELNALVNTGRLLDTALFDWREADSGLRCDLLLAADVAYEARFFDPLIRTFDELLVEGGRVLLGEPDRGIATTFFETLERRGWTRRGHPMAVSVGAGEVPVTLFEIWRSQEPRIVMGR